MNIRVNAWKQNWKSYLRVYVYLKKPLQPSQVIALKWKPVALSPHTPHIRGTFRSNSSGTWVDVLTADSITTGDTEEETEHKRERKTQMLSYIQSSAFVGTITGKEKQKVCVNRIRRSWSSLSHAQFRAQTGLSIPINSHWYVLTTGYPFVFCLPLLELQY